MKFIFIITYKDMEVSLVLTCTLTKENMENLNAIMEEKNQLSHMQSYSQKTLTEQDSLQLNEIGLIDEEGRFVSSIRPAMQILSKPAAVVRISFTGGTSIFEHSIHYDEAFQNHVALTATSQEICIDDVSKPDSIIKILKDFTGVSNIRSINLSGKFNVSEAMVIAAIIDIERRAALRAFIDELPSSQSSFNVNMIWRITNSTSPSMQWFVSVLNDRLGNHETMSLQQVQKGIDGLLDKGVVVKNDDLYQCAGEMAKLSGRMIIVDNVLSAYISKLDKENEIVSAGFTCIQSGVHDLLFVDYDGKDFMFETITSVSLLNCVEQLLSGKDIIS